MKKVKYHLRFQVIPGKNVADDARMLADFCVKHNIEEVVLFFAGEEWNNGLLSKVREAKEILEERGISVSLNPWMTVLHCDRGRGFPPDRKFKPMVSPAGEEARACASLCQTTLLKPLERPVTCSLLKEKGIRNSSLWKTASQIPYMSFLIVRF